MQFFKKQPLIQPKTRGDIVNSISENKLSFVAPESPRPSEMLDGINITSRDLLTADDTAIHELLIAAAYEKDVDMASEWNTIEVSTALNFLGKSARRDALKSSLRRLAATTVNYGKKADRCYEDVPLLVSWLESSNNEDIIKYSLPEPIKALMRAMPSYAYLEMAVLAQMKSRYSLRLYKKLTLAASKKKWQPGEENLVIVSGTTEEVAAWVGFEPENGKITQGKLRERVLNHAERDFYNIRRFSTLIKEIRGSGRGKPVERIEFHIRLQHPSHHIVPMAFRLRKRNGYIGGADAPEYRVNSSLWIKAQKQFSKRLGMMHNGFFELWQVALNEAITGVIITDNYYTRKYRGGYLLSAIRDFGAEEAAWGVISEEAHEPDLLFSRQLFNSEFDLAAPARFERMRDAGMLKKWAKHAIEQELKPDEIEQIVDDTDRAFLSELHEDDEPVAKNEVTSEDEDQPEEPLENGTSVVDFARKFMAQIKKKQEAAAKNLVTLDEATKLIVRTSAGTSTYDLENHVAAEIQNFEYSGDKEIDIEIQYFVDKNETDIWRLGKFPISSEDLIHIENNIKNYIKAAGGLEILK